MRMNDASGLGRKGLVGVKTLILTFGLMSGGGLWQPWAVWSEPVRTSQDTQLEKTTARPEFHSLSNAELLQQTESQLRASLKAFRAVMRGLAQSQLLLKRARMASDAFEIPTALDAEAERTEKWTLKTAKMQSEQARARHDAFQQQVQLMQNEKTELEANSKQIEQARLAVESFIATIDRLELPLLEIRLRVEDATLAREKMPALLQADELEAQVQVLMQQQTTLSELKEAAQQGLKNTITRLAEAKKIAVEVGVLAASAEKRYGEALKRQELLQEYTDQAPEALAARLPDLHDELVGLRGSLQLAHRRFASHQAESRRVQQQLDSVSTPKEAERLRPGAGIRIHEIEQKTEQIKRAMADYEQHLERAQALQTALNALVKEGETYQGDATVLNEHLFRMQVPIELLERAMAAGQAPADAIPQELRSATLTELKQKAVATAEDVLSEVEQSKQRLGEIGAQIETVRRGRQDAETYLEQLQQQVEAAEKARRWALELKDLTAEQVVERFQQTTERLRTNEQTVQNARDAFDKAKDQMEEEQRHFESLTDPLLRSAQQEAAAEKQTIIKKLYAIADIDLPVELNATKPLKTAAKLLDGKASDTADYQNVLATETHIIEERAAQRLILKTALNDLQLKLDAYREVMGEGDTLLQQQYANAAELKKRLGRGQLSDGAIPDGITAALNQQRIEALEADIVDLSHQATAVKQQIDKIDAPDKILEQIQKSLGETMSVVGKRLDRRRDLEKLQAQLKRTAADRSKVETVSLEQNASRRLEAGDHRADRWLDFLPSRRADEVTDLLQVYYQELIELESQQANLQSQHGLTKRMTELAEAEKETVAELLPLFQQEEAVLRTVEEETWITLEAGLVPEKAATILRAYESKTGKRLPTPPPVDPDNRVAAIATATDLLFTRHTERVAATKWTQLFEQRLSAAGLDGEIGAFQDQLGAIEAQSAAIQRGTYRLVGHPLEELGKLDEAEAPKTAAERQDFLQGEIGALRADRTHIRKQAISQILIRLAIIVAAAFVITLILSWVFNQISKRYRDPAVSGNSQTLLVLSFLQTMGKLGIWVTAIVMIFSTLGFNVGAILAGLGIGGLAMAMAARETLSDMLGGIMLFIERPFVIGDTVQIGSGAAAHVVDMTWRTTRMVDAFDYYFSVPNSQVANATIQNFTRTRPTGDYISIYVSPEYDPDQVIAVVTQALESCEAILQDQTKATMLAGVTTVGYTTVMEYWPFWYTDDYHGRAATRAAVWYCIWQALGRAGIPLKTESLPPQNLSENPIERDLAPEGG